MRSVTQFLEDLRDGREVYVYGERVEDVTTHPVTAIGAKTAQVDYEISEDPACADFALATLPTGERISRYYAPPRSAADLIHRRRLIEEGARRCLGFPPFAKEGGTDALNAAAVAAKQIDKQRGTDYYARVERYREFLALHDYSLAVAMTDVKGDRSLRPAQQPNPDVYVHIVEERPDGIVLRGAKAHITAAPFCNELLVIPTRALTAEDTAYAVCCGVPANAPGVRMIVRDPVSAGKDPTEYPVSGKY
ncbi:hypothetical protein D2Q93_16325 [Alicyclobacillaceae bacterium I2511]|nr:hypothetical protein D2Q93_16325 [Alicyclobacillaceae bacterium I2511]